MIGSDITGRRSVCIGSVAAEDHRSTLGRSYRIDRCTCARKTFKIELNIYPIDADGIPVGFLVVACPVAVNGNIHLGEGIIIAGKWRVVQRTIVLQYRDNQQRIVFCYRRTIVFNGVTHGYRSNEACCRSECITSIRVETQRSGIGPRFAILCHTGCGCK